MSAWIKTLDDAITEARAWADHEAFDPAWAIDVSAAAGGEHDV